MEQRSFVEEETETSQSTTSADEQVEITSINIVVSRSDSADENSPGDEKVASETAPGDEKVSSEGEDEKVSAEGSPGDDKAVAENPSIGEKEGSQEEEEEEECGFCIFMKSGPCGERFKVWQDCIEEAEKSDNDIVRQCAQTTTLLKACMEMNPQYYGPVLEAEKAMEADLTSPAEDARTEVAASAESTAGDEEISSAGGEEISTAGGEARPTTGGEENENVIQTIETSEVVTVVVDDEGQVEEVNIVDVEVSLAA